MHDSSAAMTTKYRVPTEVRFRELGDEAVLLHLESGEYFGLNEVGTRMWNALIEHRAVEPVVTELSRVYDVSKSQLRRDLLALVSSLREQRLLEIDEG